MIILEVEVVLLELPLTEPFVASHGITTSRTVSVTKITTDRGVGWGECSALPAATYTAESAAGSYRAIVDDLAPPLLGTEMTPDRDAMGRLLSHAVDRPMARSCLEMALLDASLTSSGTPLAAWLGAQRRFVPAGVSLGLGSVDATVGKAAALVADGYRRLKVKIEPGHDRTLVAGLRAELPDVELHVDANGAYRHGVGPSGAADVVDTMLSIIDAGADAVEQPFPTSDPTSAAELVARLAGARREIPVVADEAVEGAEDANRLLRLGAMTGLSIKPGRLGGLLAALDLHDLCVERNVAATAGGMLETGLGRHALAALAALPGFTLTGDLSPAARWLATDPWSDLTLDDGRITVPTGPGVAPEPDREILHRFTVEQATVR